MVASCWALGCTERLVPGSSYTFHRIPRDRLRAQQWLKALGREDTEFSKLSHKKICSKHFTRDCFSGWNERGISLCHDAVPTLFLGSRDKRRVTRTRILKKATPTREPEATRTRLSFNQLTEEHIKSSPRDALRAFRMAKAIVEKKASRIQKLERVSRLQWAKIQRYSTRVAEIPMRWRIILGLDRFRMNEGSAQMTDPQLSDLEEESEDVPDSTKNKKDPEKDAGESDGTDSTTIKKESDEMDSTTIKKDSESNGTDSVKIKEEIVSDDDDSDMSGLMDEDEWVRSFGARASPPPGPSEEAILGLPLEKDIKGEEDEASTQMPVIKSVSTLQPILLIPMAVQRGVRPLSTPILPLRIPPTNVLGDFSYDSFVLKRATSTQTTIEGSLACICPNVLPKKRSACAQTESTGPSSDTETEPTVSDDPPNFDSFGKFVARKLKSLPREEAVFLQDTYLALFK